MASQIPLPSPFVFVGYIDPSAGHVFTSLGPIIMSLLGGLLGFLTIFAGKIKIFLKSIFHKNKQKKNEAKEKNSSNRP